MRANTVLMLIFAFTTVLFGSISHYNYEQARVCQAQVNDVGSGIKVPRPLPCWALGECK